MWFILLTTFLFLVALVGLLVALARREHRVSPIGPDPEQEAERILDARYARGEIDDEEYRRRLDMLRRAASAREDR